MKQVKFQYKFTLAEFLKQSGTDGKRLVTLEASRWPSGFCCPSCADTRDSRFVRQGRTYRHCHRCRMQITVAADPIFQATKLPLARIGKHKLLEGMAPREGGYVLDGRVEIGNA